MLTGESTLSETALDVDAGAEDLDTQPTEEEADNADLADVDAEIDVALDSRINAELDADAETRTPPVPTPSE